MKVQDERSYKPHITANKKLLSGLVEPHSIPAIKFKRRKNRSQPNMCLYELDPTFPSKTEAANTKFFYNDFKGLQMTYPEDTNNVRYVTRNLSELKLLIDHKDDNNFNVIVGHPKKIKRRKHHL